MVSCPTQTKILDGTYLLDGALIQKYGGAAGNCDSFYVIVDNYILSNNKFFEFKQSWEICSVSRHQVMMLSIQILVFSVTF